MLFSQKSYQFPEKFNSVYDFKPHEAAKQILKDLKSDKERENAERFVSMYIYSEQSSFDLNKIYLDWPEAEGYFIKVMNTVLPKSQNKKNLDIFLQRLTLSNAYATRFGNVFFNIGAICDAENEAFLAHIIAHESGHYFLNHMIRQMQMQEDVSRTRNVDLYMDYRRLGRNLEIQADSFAIAAMKKAHYNSESVMNYFENENLKERISQYSVSYKNMLKASSMSTDQLKRKKQSQVNQFRSHPSTIERFETVKSISKDTFQLKNFIVDSAYFFKLKKIANEERKKICFEECNFNDCIQYSFLDYLYEPKNLKNLYYLIESLRRAIYSNPTIAKTGFLTEYIEDSELFKYNSSILYKPDYIFSGLKQYNDLKDHTFFTSTEKPFNTYAEAFLYFSQEALKLKFNEANFSLGLYYYGIKKQDSCKKYLNSYIKTGVGLNYECATNIYENGRPNIEKGKLFILYNNTGTYTGYNFNYFLCNDKRKYNSEIKKELCTDTTKTTLLLVNELLGNSPKKLNTTEKLIYIINSLYNEDDIDVCKKIRLKSSYAGENKEISDIFKKHILIFAPELYNWYKENQCDRLFYIDQISQHSEYLKEKEYFNNYTAYYLDVNSERPYFKDAVRNSFTRKQTEKEIRKELFAFLYE
ncbi:MAG: M48 family metalloprotease [Bacteroidia bacterium]